MKVRISAFRTDLITLNLWDVVKLLLGLKVEESATRVVFWRRRKTERKLFGNIN